LFNTDAKRLSSFDAATRLSEEAANAVRAFDPSERPVMTLLATGELSPWAIAALMGAVGGILGARLTKRYFVTLTKESIYVQRGSLAGYQPTELLHIVALGEAGGLVVSHKQGKRWGTLRLQLDGRSRPTRLNVSWASFPKMDRLLAALEQAAEPAQV